MTTQKNLAVERFGEIFELNANESLRPGDRIINKGSEAATVSTISKSDAHPSLLATMKPGQSVRVTDVGRPDEEVLGLESADGESVIEPVSAVSAATADFNVTPEVAMLDGEVQGLFGAVPFLAGAGGVAAAAGAIGLAALAGGSTGDDNGSGDGNTGKPTGNGGVSPAANAGGLAGGIAQLNEGVAQTALNPLTAVTAPIADGLVTVGNALANSGEPTGVGAALGELLGLPGANTAGADSSNGVVGLLNTVSTSLNDAVANSPLEPLSQLINPLTQTLGSAAGEVDGIAQGVANIGTSLIGDNSVLSPLTSDLLGPIVGTSTGQDGGLPQTLTQIGEGLTDLTNPTSAVAPLNALTDPLSDTVLTQLASGIQAIGDGLAGVSAQDPSGVSSLLGSLLGGGTTDAAAVGASPLDGLTGLLGGGLLGGGLPGADALGGDLLGGGLLGGGLLGGLPLSTDALAGNSLPVSDAGDLLNAGNGLSSISSVASLPGLDALNSILPV